MLWIQLFAWSQVLPDICAQDISKLRRDVKVAFEDMTSQMNRCCLHYTSAICCHVSQHLCDSREQFFGGHIASDSAVNSSSGLSSTIFLAVTTGKRQIAKCVCLGGPLALRESALFCSSFLSSCCTRSSILSDIRAPHITTSRCRRHCPHSPSLSRLHDCSSVSF